MHPVSLALWTRGKSHKQITSIRREVNGDNPHSRMNEKIDIRGLLTSLGAARYRIPRMAYIDQVLFWLNRSANPSRWKLKLAPSKHDVGPQHRVSKDQ